jgi:2-polyprenyl-6-methoxyphenol hydroxylase-like FAD-dependent oxidoreductase
MDVAIFERADDWRKIQVGGGIHLWNNAMRAMQQLGLDGRVREIGSAVERVEFRTQHGGMLAVWPAGDIERELGVPTVGVARADLQRVLVGAVVDGTVRLGEAVTGYAQDDAGVTVQLAGGGEERGDLLVGADGINSVIRAQLHGPSKPRFAGYSVWQAITDIQDQRAPVGIFRVLWGRGARFAFYHVGGERLYWFCVLNAPEGERKIDRELLLERFRGWMEPTETILSGTPPESIDRSGHYDRPPLGRWGEGRVTLLGDAAHPMTFNVGQGACQAIEDAVVLARTLSQERDASAALRAYESDRMVRTAALQKRAWQLGSLGRWQNPVVCWVRDRVMKSVLGGPGLRSHREDMAHQF